MKRVLLILATSAAALIAGLLYGYAVSVNPGLKRLPNLEYLAAMKSINIAIQNPLFFASFLGTLLLLPACALVHYSRPLSLRFKLLAIAAAIYAGGVIGITFVGNIPLNDRLHKFDLNNASEESTAEMRKSYEVPWNRLHAVRTVASVAVLVLAIGACVSNPKQK